MSLINKKEPWSKFLLKSLILFMLTGLLFFYLMDRYLVYIGQDDGCIEGAKLFLVDKDNKDLKKGELYAFYSKDLSPLYKEGTKFLKYLVAVPSDVVTINKDGIFINGSKVREGLFLSNKLNKKDEFFFGTKTLATNEYWFFGNTNDSFDSRYWGAVKYEDIIGRAVILY